MTWDPVTIAVRERLAEVARSRLRVLFTGPSGVGKTHLVAELHAGSGRRGELVVVDCPAIQPTLFESLLFGHVRHAFTGADRANPGLVKRARGGTLFFEEVGDLSPDNQSRLLSFLGSGWYTPVGATTAERADVRVVAATHQDLRERLRPELRHRLAEVVIELPPLDQRPRDIVPLAEGFVTEIAELEGWRPLPLSSEARIALLRRTWEGNVRELRTAVHLALNRAHRARSRALRPEHFELAPVVVVGSWRRRREAFEREALLATLRASEWNVSEAARQLGVPRPWVHSQMRRLGITRER